MKQRVSICSIVRGSPCSAEQQNASTIWEACQKQLQHAGASTPCVKSVLRHFFQSRFESFVTPRRRYICLLRAIEMVAGDERWGPGVQRRDKTTLQAMGKSSDCFIEGLAGDYGEACLEFLRYFDVRGHDLARAAVEVDADASRRRQLRRLLYHGAARGSRSRPCANRW